MPDDLEKYYVVGGLYSLETLARAKELALLAEEQVDDRLGCTLSGMALVCAIANLASVVEQRLIRAIATTQAGGGFDQTCWKCEIKWAVEGLKRGYANYRLLSLE